LKKKKKNLRPNKKSEGKKGESAKWVWRKIKPHMGGKAFGSTKRQSSRRETRLTFEKQQKNVPKSRRKKKEGIRGGPNGGRLRRLKTIREGKKKKRLKKKSRPAEQVREAGKLIGKKPENAQNAGGFYKREKKRPKKVVKSRKIGPIPSGGWGKE